MGEAERIPDSAIRTRDFSSGLVALEPLAILIVLVSSYHSSEILAYKYQRSTCSYAMAVEGFGANRKDGGGVVAESSSTRCTRRLKCLESGFGRGGGHQ